MSSIVGVPVNLPSHYRFKFDSIYFTNSMIVDVRGSLEDLRSQVTDQMKVDWNSRLPYYTFPYLSADWSVVERKRILLDGIEYSQSDSTNISHLHPNFFENARQEAWRQVGEEEMEREKIQAAADRVARFESFQKLAQEFCPSLVSEGTG